MIAIEIILDAFSDCNITTLIPKGQKFEHICFLPDDTTAFSSEYLYLCTVSQAQDVHMAHKDCFFLCPDSNGLKVPVNAAMIHGVTDIIEIARRSQAVLIEMVDWIHEMDRLTSIRAPYQAYLNLAEYRLNNSIYILDAAMVLIAATENIVDDDPYDTALRSSHYHSEEFLSALKKLDRFSRINNNSGTILYEKGAPNIYSAYSHWLWDSGMPTLSVVMICCNTEPNDCLAARFELLVDGLNERFAAFVSESTTKNYHFVELFEDMIFNSLEDTKIIRERVRLTGIPMSGSFVVFTIRLVDKNSYSIGRLAKRIQEVEPDVKTITKDFQLVLLLCSEDESSDTLSSLRNQTVNRIRNILNECNAVCGISETYHHFTDSKSAYDQAVCALDIGGTIVSYRSQWNELVCPAELNKDNDLRFYYYDDLYSYAMFRDSMNPSHKLFTLTPLHRSIIRLIEEDRTHGTNNAKILYTYLFYERNASKTGAVLHMHRNNIIYRISRIESKLNVNLEDFQTRYRILNVFVCTEIDFAIKAQITANR